MTGGVRGRNGAVSSEPGARRRIGPGRSPRISAAAFLLALGFTTGATAQSGAQAPDAPQQGRELTAHRPEVPYVHGLVVAGHPLAAMAGLRMLMQGGLAADAAVATMATLAVVEPWASGPGGNGFLTYFDKATGKVENLSFTGAAPLALRPEAMTPRDLDTGIKASVVPGAFGGWIAVLKRSGTLSLRDVLAPAIDYARNGHPLDAGIARTIARYRTVEDHPTSAEIFRPGGKPPAGGDIFHDLPLADTYQRLVDAEQAALAAGRSREEALQAADDLFYRGAIAREIADFHAAHGGYLGLEDLAAYRPRWDAPLHVTYRGYDVYSSPPTSRGGVETLMQLKLIEGLPMRQLGHNSPEAIHALAQAIRIAKSDIYHSVGDPREFGDTATPLLSEGYVAARRALIGSGDVAVVPAYGDVAALSGNPARTAPAGEGVDPDGHTTSLSIIDQAGNVLVATPTLGGGFGTGVVIGRTGLLLNNGLRLGSTSPYKEDRAYIKPGRPGLLNNSPTLVLKDGAYVMTMGSPGGETIGQTQFQALVNVLDFGMPIQDAVEAPRFSLAAKPNFYRTGAEITLQYENRLPAATVEALAAKGYRMKAVPSWSIGSNQGTLLNAASGSIMAGADPRRQQYAVGW
ncbi:gamma-glutamyltransferase family protein [Methylobacterium gregans]|uniref:Glutathione hydrolase proenzyme n=1 Tax=Methylobacterium gregans TaxID=374424 RepID=A0AA37MB03_9HYPH|nr:gamma-glutamyltransferase [Methylobacterium gregans]MDQ0521115.1 gamma-glutamyltranspeptidase/glutathione hydrolase [Methylobacterium gregans]GJD79157.1 Glutathione hydrolase proenzyme [Methylobacterium gregans]GLS54280.1 gamma-glutamyltranspeptidase [Methylobacterium gregans]